MNRKGKFFITIFVSFVWLLFSIVVSLNWLHDLKNHIGIVASVIIVTGIAYIPGFINMNLIISLILYRTNKPRKKRELDWITILIPVYNEERTIYNTLISLANQDFKGKLKIILVNNNSKDLTLKEIYKAMAFYNLDVTIINEYKKGKHYALNKGLSYIETPYFITLDADTILHESAVTYITRHMLAFNNKNVAAVAGGVMVSNGNQNLLTKIQKYDYLLSITCIKRMQGLFNSTLVAQGAFSIYKTDLIKKLNGWDDCLGEDIVLTWKLLQQGYHIKYEPKAVSFTTVPTNLSHFIKQRSRWSRGMIEGFKHVSPFKQGSSYAKYLTILDLFIPFIDFSFLFFFIPGIIFACLGYYYIVGFMTLFVLPLTLLSHVLMFRIEKKEVTKSLQLYIEFNFIDYLIFILIFQLLNSFSSLIGYLQEFLDLKRKWK